MMDDGDSGSEYESDIHISDSESEGDEELDEGIPMNRGPWFPVLDPGTFSLPEPNFHEQTGPVNFLPNSTILDYFMKFIDMPGRSVIDLLVAETNRYATQCIAERSRPPRVVPEFARLKNWTPVTRQEIPAFVGLVLSMGVVKKPTYESYWENNPRSWSMETPNFAQVMSRNRFQAILQFLHCNNNETAVPHDQPGYDPLHKISPVIDILNQTFSENYRLNQDVCVDERVVGFKGRHQLKQYLSNKKAHKWGIKLWVLAESYTGYTHQIKVYKGRRNEARSENGQGYQVVTELMTPHLNKEHHVTVDSFFTSPKLVHDLKDKGTFCTGTVIKTRRGMPKSYRTAKLQKGDMTVKYQGQLMAVLWADRRLVTILTTTGSASMINTTNSRGTDLAIPSAVKRYNFTMGGVDLGDQLLLQFEPNFKSVKMWRKLLFHQLVTAAVNAFICYKRTFVVETKLDHLKFHQQLCQDLIGNHRDGTRNQQMRTVRLEHRQLGRITERHFPERIPDGKRKKCVVCAGTDRLKKSRIQWWCGTCKVGLCVGRCFKRYHTRINFEE
ncbi:unnamed protein product [Mytilus edulis]|uniref:PiggyBac transposable element-derived protein domain-containing protein n=1 Tax=Mytilus edulis TaxID=6550 RepID=A0A8S3VB35_MYTED|nr:unnamed protein product [Mytilus edulis]